MLMAITITHLNAQEEKESNFSFSGSVDAYWQTNLSASDDISQSFGTSFADELGFALGMANAVIAYEKGKTGAVMDLAFGPRGDAATGGYNLNQLYVYWNVSEKVSLSMGRFNTYLGYEVISPVGNFNYRTSYLFSSGPFSHVGLRANFALSEDWSLMLTAMNVTDVNNNLTGEYAAGAQLGFKGQYLNLYYDNGEALGFEVDYTGGFDLSEKFYLGINAAYADNDGEGFYGAAILPQLTTSDLFSIGLRFEYFGRMFAEEGLDDVDVLATTLTANFKVDNLTIKPELRLDKWNDNEPYLNSEGQATDNLAAFLVAAVYSF